MDCRAIFPRCYGDNERWLVSWQRKYINSSFPMPPERFWDIAGCCGGMLAISEIRYAPNNNRDPFDSNNTHRYRIFVEGEEVHTGEETPMRERERIAVFDCCNTHWDGIRYNHRYALLGIGDFIEEADMPMTVSELQEELAQDEDYQEPPITLTDDTVATRCYDDDAPTEYFETAEGVRFIPDQAIVKKTITDTRERQLFHNGGVIGTDKRYDGLYCCGEFALCTYLDDDYLSGWKDERESGDTIETDRKWSPHPNWGDAMPPAAKDRERWEEYRELYPGFSVDVFHQGAKIGTFNVSDANSPIPFDRLGTGAIWLLRAARESTLRMFSFPGQLPHSIGNAPWSLEGAPICKGEKLLIPYNGGITTSVGADTNRRVFP